MKPEKIGPFTKLNSFMIDDVLNYIKRYRLKPKKKKKSSKK